MWNRLPAIGTLRLPVHLLLVPSNQNAYQQFRTTFILKRRWPPGLHKKWQTAKPLKAAHFVYDLVDNTTVKKKEDLEVILTDYVSGIGNQGDIVKMKPSFVYRKLLLPGLAVYASPENIEKYAKKEGDEQRRSFSSPYVEGTMNYLSNIYVPVLMNKEVPWTLQPWHVRMSFRKRGIHVPEHAIKLPEEPITGPNLELNGKYFEVIITINNLETVPVKCRLLHYMRCTTPEELEQDLPFLPIFPDTTDKTSTDKPSV